MNHLPITVDPHVAREVLIRLEWISRQSARAALTEEVAFCRNERGQAYWFAARLLKRKGR